MKDFLYILVSSSVVVSSTSSSGFSSLDAVALVDAVARATPARVDLEGVSILKDLLVTSDKEWNDLSD